MSSNNEAFSLFVQDPKRGFLGLPSGVPKLFLKGQVPGVGTPAVALVGTRKASRYGLQKAYDFAFSLAKAGVEVWSGLARGVDSAAHEGAVAARGRTFAFLGHGLHFIYPRENRDLVQRMMDSGGGILSEYPPGTAIQKHFFPARNRLIAAAVQAVVVIEAPEKSGALITAQWAIDLGRDVWVVPSRLGDVGFGGNLKWLRQGAYPLVDVEDLLVFLGIESTTKEGSPETEPPWIQALFSGGPRTLSELVDVDQALIESQPGLPIYQKLELGIRQGWIQEIAPQTFMRTPSSSRNKLFPMKIKHEELIQSLAKPFSFEEQ